MQNLEVWLVGGSQHLYGPEALAQVTEFSKAVTGGLARSTAMPLKIMAKPVMTTPEAIFADMAGVESVLIHRWTDLRSSRSECAETISITAS